MRQKGSADNKIKYDKELLWYRENFLYEYFYLPKILDA